MRNVACTIAGSKSPAVRINRRRSTQLGTMMLPAVGLLTGCMLFTRPPADIDYARTRSSASGVYHATIHPDGDSIPQGRLQRWTLHLETADGTPVDRARIEVGGGMPQHGHGLPTRPRVTRPLGAGNHLVEGLKFNMGGWWVVTFRVESAAGTDSLVFNVKL